MTTKLVTTDVVPLAKRRRAERRSFWLVMVLLALCAAPAGWGLLKHFEAAREQRALVQETTRRGGVVHYDFQVDDDLELNPHATPDIPGLLRNILGDDFFFRVAHVALNGSGVRDGDLPPLAGFGRLDVLDISGSVVTDAGLSHLEDLYDLRQIDVRGTAVSESGVQRLRQRFPHLRIFYDRYAAKSAPPFRRRWRRAADSFVRADVGLGTKGDEWSGDPGRRPSAETDAAIESGVAFLVRNQLDDGRWSFAKLGDPQLADAPAADLTDVRVHGDTAATGLTLLALLGSGHHHLGDAYHDAVDRGLNYLIGIQKENGDLYGHPECESSAYMWMYSHAIATIALCEAYGMTQDERLRGPAQRALDFAVAAQHDEYGGWRYTPNHNSDTSVTGWMTMALKSGQLAGLRVPAEALERVRGWLDRAQASSDERHLYVYNPLAPDSETKRRGLRPNRTMTAVGLLARLYFEWRRDDPQMIAGADYLLANPPGLGTDAERRRDTYYWYYATQVMLHMRGEYWETWNQQLTPVLLESQITSGPIAGSWDPFEPVPDRWAAQAGRLYVTALNLLSLEVYYRYLPIHEDLTKEISLDPLTAPRTASPRRPARG